MSKHSTHAQRTSRAATLRRGLSRSAVAVAGGAVVASGMIAATTTSASAATGWDEVAACESGGDWSINTGNGYYGGLQFSDRTWDAYGGEQYASTADQATKSQQIAIGERVLEGQGAGAWPNCGGPLSGGADTSGAPAAEEQEEAPEQEQQAPEPRESDQQANRSTERESTEPQGDWSCDGDGIADNCDENGFTKETEKKQEEPKQEQQEAPQEQEQQQDEQQAPEARDSDQQANRSTERESRESSEPQGDWSCDGDGIPNNCDENGFTKETEKKQEEPAQQEAPAQESAPAPQESAGEPGSKASGDLSVAGTLEVDGKMGPKTITALQDWLGVEQTGEMDEDTTLALQAWAKTSQDGKIGANTVAGLQHEIGAEQNGSDEIDGDTVEVLQAFLNLY